MSFSISSFIFLTTLFLASNGQWCEQLQNGSGIPSQSALLTRILSSAGSPSISFCPFIIEGDGCDLMQGIDIRGSAFLHCDDFLASVDSSITGCTMNCPGRHFNVSGTLSLDGPWTFIGATRGSILIQTFGNLVGYRISWINNNNDSGQGAAIHAQTKANLNLIHPTFIKNYALALGAAVFIDNSNAYIAQGLFSNNTFGAVYVKEADSAVAFYDNLFIGNHGPVVVECSDHLVNTNTPGVISYVTWVNNVFLQNRDEQGVDHNCVDSIGTQCIETSQLCNKTIATRIPTSMPTSTPPTVVPSTLISTFVTSLPSKASHTAVPSTQIPPFVTNLPSKAPPIVVPSTLIPPFVTSLPSKAPPTVVPSTLIPPYVTSLPSKAPTVLTSQDYYFPFKSHWSKDGRSWCIGLSSMNMYNGNIIRLRPCKNSDTQKWFFNVSSGQIHNKLNNAFCLASRGGKSGNWDGLELWNCSEDTSKWLFSAEDRTITYRIENNTTFPCITLQEGIAKVAQILRLQSCSFNSSTQQWDRI